MLKKENTGLIIIDIQGKLAGLVHDSDALISNCKKLIKGAQALDLPIIWLEQNPDKLGSTVEELSSLLKMQQPIAKFTFDACAEPQFMDAVRSANVDTWLVCGIEAHICVYQTALNLKRTGVEVQLVCDCISSRTLANKNLAVSKLLNHGIDLTGLEMCLYELLKDCRATEFKEILSLIK
ncbi:isochorismatase hydrolase [Psychromonas ingrahamii 37]|uniref:Isochorismatase hydrolase n=1 Tax=Psychromonas ingrahamii (strain DSM 17664 / CCUG 51855 / 37) TaxID=357804 RepID=A1SWJ9_PSYIN|nr:isochorismatase family protein [Psychromonas ingrahamii]ABM03864.1 isochorismatase hydrolase [Psychromonas ingrahamii 37]